jgi:hypothetical protein
MNEDDLLQAWKNQVGRARQIPAMQPESKTESVRQLPHD